MNIHKSFSHINRLHISKKKINKQIKKKQDSTDYEKVNNHLMGQRRERKIPTSNQAKKSIAIGILYPNIQSCTIEDTRIVVHISNGFLNCNLSNSTNGRVVSKNSSNAHNSRSWRNISSKPIWESSKWKQPKH